MPKRATLDQRIAWHVAHAKACGCREISTKLRDEMAKRGIVPASRPGGRAER